MASGALNGGKCGSLPKWPRRCIFNGDVDARLKYLAYTRIILLQEDHDEEIPPVRYGLAIRADHGIVCARSHETGRFAFAETAPGDEQDADPEAVDCHREKAMGRLEE